MLRCLVPLLTALTISITASSSQAALVIQIGDLTLAPGGTGLVDVLISSDVASPPPTLINIANFQFSISTSGATRLEFTPDPQPDPQLANTNYVFYGDSFDTSFALPVGSVSSVNVPHDTFTGGDSTITTLTDVTVPSSPDPAKLLVQLQVTALTGLPPVIGDTFAIELTDASFSSTEDPSITFSSNLGTVTIASGVPEPGSWLVFAGLASFTGLFSRIRRR